LLPSHHTQRSARPRHATCAQALADKKKGLTDEDLLALVGDEVHQAAVVWELLDLQVGGARRVAVFTQTGVTQEWQTSDRRVTEE
jgi:hypothetical protein